MTFYISWHSTILLTSKTFTLGEANDLSLTTQEGAFASKPLGKINLIKYPI